jgi:Amidohydrolase family
VSKSVRLAIALPLIWLVHGRAQGNRPGNDVTAFVGVDVVTMQRDEVVRQQTVLVRDGMIVAVGPVDRVAVPEGAARIDGRGKYLMPGLTDFHTHIELPVDLPMYLAAGVTTVATMGTRNPALPAWRDSIRAGQKLGPDLIVGYFVNAAQEGDPTGIHSAQQARDVVAHAQARGYDFIKVYNALDTSEFSAVMDEARRRQMPVLGHAVRSIGLRRGFAMGQVAVVHAEEYIYADFRNQIDTALIAPAAGFTRQAGAYVIPNLSAFAAIARQWGNSAVIDTFLSSPDTLFLAPHWARRWRNSDYVRRRGSIANRVGFLSRLTRALSDSSVPLMLGTDSPDIPGMYPGQSIHEDLRLMVEAGLTPYLALSAGTRTPGEFVQKYFRNLAPTGLVAPGFRADLVLLARNPLEGVQPAAAPLGVMTRGRWLPAADLARMREDARRSGRSIGVVFDSLLSEQGIDAATAQYWRLLRDSAAAFLFQPEMLNDIGYRLVREARAREAVAVFRLNVESYPGSANAYDSYADGLLALGDSAAAADAYRQVLRLVPGEPNLDPGLRQYLTGTAEQFLARSNPRGQ